MEDYLKASRNLERNLSFGSKKKDGKRSLTMGEKRFMWTHKKRHICSICHKEVRDFFDAEFDHNRAHTRGGRTSISNTLIVHKLCNRMKGKKTLTEIKKRLGTHKPKKRKTPTKKPKRRNNPLSFKIPKFDYRI